MKSCLSRTRRAELPKFPSSIDTIELLDLYKTTTPGEKFLIHEKNNILLFASVDTLRILSYCKNRHSDGTFHVASKVYYCYIFFYLFIVYLHFSYLFIVF